MGTLYVKDAIYRSSVLLQDVAPQFSRWPEKELVNWLNDGQRAIAKYLPMSCSRIDAVKLTPGTRQTIISIAPASIKSSDGSVPASNVVGIQLFDITRNMGSDGLTPGKSIRLVSREVLDSQRSDWHTISSAAGVVEQFVFDPRTPKHFYVSPGVRSSGGDVWVEASWLANPVDVPNTGTSGSPAYAYDGASTTAISIDDKYIDDLVNYMVARAYQKDAEFSANINNAINYSNLFLQSLNAQVAAATGVNPNLQTLPLSPMLPAAAK